jgi:hypothetical protein
MDRTCLFEVKFSPKYYIGLIVMELFELYQGDPVFSGLAGRLADGGRAGAGYLGFGAGLELAAGSRIIPLNGEGSRAVTQIQVCRAAVRQVYGVNLAGFGEAVVVLGARQLIMVGHFSEGQVLMKKL